MNHNDLTFTESSTKSGHTVRIHRATCRRATTAKALDAAPQSSLRLAKAASCCKPKQEVVDSALAHLLTPTFEERQERLETDTSTALEITAEKEAEKAEAERMDYLAEESELELAERIADLARDTDEHVIVEMPYSSSGVAKHYWKVFCRAAATDVALAVGAVPSAKADRVVLRGQASRVHQAGHILRMVWGEGYDQFKHYRKHDEAHQQIKASEPGVHWNHSRRGPDELAWMTGFAHGVVQHLKGRDLDEDNAAGQGNAWAADHALANLQL